MPTLKRPKPQKFAHTLVAETAKELAGEFYEEAAHDDTFFKFYPEQKIFIKREWHRFVETARVSLSKMLGVSVVNEEQKAIILDALLKHSAMPGNVDRRVAERELMGVRH